MRSLLILMAAALALSACGPVPEGPPRPKCVKGHTETNLGDGMAMYMITGSKLMGYVASQKTVCDEWSDGQPHPELN